MSVEAREQAINDGFKPIRDFGYDDRFPYAIEVNEDAIKKAFRVAELDYCNGITIEPMPQSDVERSRGRWNRRLFATGKGDNGWKIQVNDEVMMERLERKDPRKSHRENFIQGLNGLIKSAVLECVRKEWRLEMNPKGYLFTALDLMEFIDNARCSLFLYRGDGRTLVRESK